MRTPGSIAIYRQETLRIKSTLVLACAAALSLYIWLQFAPRYFYETGILDRHGRHVPLLFAHILATSLGLFAGPFLLWSGFRKAPLAVHRTVGLVYLLGGGAGTFAGIVLSIVAKHRAPAFYVGTFFLGLVWLAAAGIAYRAIRNRQIDVHKEWMIRSYVLTWSFVACRIPELSFVQSLGPGGDSTVLWASWAVPLFIAEVAIQWRRTAARSSQPSGVRTSA